MLSPVHQTLSASAALVALMGGALRAYRHGNAPQGAVRPYITWSQTLTPENTLSELPLVDRTSVQIDVWCEQDPLVMQIAAAARDAIEPHAHMISMSFDGWDAESKCYRVTMQFDWFNPRELISS